MKRCPQLTPLYDKVNPTNRSMCRLCSSDPAERRQEVDSLDEMAARLEKLASHYRGLAQGYILPHSEASKVVQITAQAVIRGLVQEWV